MSRPTLKTIFGISRCPVAIRCLRREDSETSHDLWITRLVPLAERLSFISILTGFCCFSPAAGQPTELICSAIAFTSWSIFEVSNILPEERQRALNTQCSLPSGTLPGTFPSSYFPLSTSLTTNWNYFPWSCFTCLLSVISHRAVNSRRQGHICPIHPSPQCWEQCASYREKTLEISVE